MPLPEVEKAHQCCRGGAGDLERQEFIEKYVNINSKVLTKKVRRLKECFLKRN